MDIRHRILPWLGTKNVADYGWWIEFRRNIRSRGRADLHPRIEDHGSSNRQDRGVRRYHHRHFIRQHERRSVCELGIIMKTLITLLIFGLSLQATTVRRFMANWKRHLMP